MVYCEFNGKVVMAAIMGNIQSSKSSKQLVGVLLIVIRNLLMLLAYIMQQT
jgi:hypothetical protein